MDVEDKVALLLKSPTEEVLTEQDLCSRLERSGKITHYIGFEISGFVHLGTGLMAGAKIADMQKAGIDCTMLLADWHTWINDKLGGDLEAIRSAAEHLKESLKISCDVMGADSGKVKFVLGSDLCSKEEFWRTFVHVSKNTTLSRVKRSITIMGRKEGDLISFGQLLYPPMQVADAFMLGVGIAHGGMDQRKAHVVMREVAPKIGKEKPIALHHHLLLGLQKPPIWPVPEESMQDLWADMKMSKSKPSTAIFIHDSPEDIIAKVSGAFCPEHETKFNPILDWVKHILFRDEKFALHIDRPAKFGGLVDFASFKELEQEFQNGSVHPLDLKSAVSRELVKLLGPARKQFEKPKMKDMHEAVKKLMAAKQGSKS